MSIFLCKPHIRKNSFSGVITGKQDSLIGYISGWNHSISMNFYMWTDNQKRKTSYPIFFMRCG